MPEDSSSPSIITQHHGLAGSIRSSTESETFDLGGLSGSTIETVMSQAMDEPFVLLKTEMIRITLVVGAGKQSRQKYDSQAMKIVTSTLQRVGFIEDRGASCVLDCQGTYKVQHDTGKNLKTVVVFPKIQSSSSAAAEATEDNNNNNPDVSSSSTLPFSKSSMEYKVATSSLGVFQNLVKVKCPTWFEKRTLLQLIELELVEKVITPVDNLLMKGQQVSSELQNFYNILTEIDEKQKYLKDVIHQHVDNANLTQIEINYLLEQIQTRIDNLNSNNSSNDNKKKTTTTLLEKAKERLKKIKGITSIPYAKLKHHVQIGKLWKELSTIPQVNGSGGRLLSVQETKYLSRRDGIISEIENLEVTSRGWLEDDDVFNIRLEQCRSEYQQRYAKAMMTNSSKGNKKKKGGGSNIPTIGSSTKTRVPITKWITPGENKTIAMDKKKKRLAKGDVFGAMMAADSSSDDDEDEDDNNAGNGKKGLQNNSFTTASNVPEASLSAVLTNSKSSTNNNNNNKSKKKKKKKKSKKGEILDNATTTTNQEEKNLVVEGRQQHQQQVVAAATSAVMVDGGNILVKILKMLLAILTWLLSLVFGSSTNKAAGNNKNKKQKKK